PSANGPWTPTRSGATPTPPNWPARCTGSRPAPLSRRTDTVFASISFGSCAGMVLRRDGRRLATCSDDGTVKVWDPPDGRLRYTLRGETGFLASAVFSPDGKGLLVSCSDGTAMLCDVESGRPLRTFSGHAGAVRTAVFDHGGE